MSDGKAPDDLLIAGWLTEEEVLLADLEGPEALNEMRERALRARLAALAEYAEIFMAPGFKFSIRNARRHNDAGAIIVPECELTSEALSFLRMAGEFGWILERFNWPKWKGADEATALVSDLDQIANASPIQLAKLLTVLIRGERFCDGNLLRAFESGLLLAISQRAAVLINIS